MSGRRARMARERKNHPMLYVGWSSYFSDVLKEIYTDAGSPCHGPCLLDALARGWVTRSMLSHIPKWSVPPQETFVLAKVATRR